MPTMSQITMPFQFVFVAMMTIVPIVNNRRSYLNRITRATHERVLPATRQQLQANAETTGTTSRTTFIERAG